MKVGIVGYGNMGSALARAIGSAVGKDSVIVYEISSSKREEALNSGFSVANDLSFLAKESDLIILAVKPKDIDGVLKSLKDGVGESILVSIAAGVDIGSIEKVVGSDKKIVRIMPNINLTVGKGVMAITHNGSLSEEEFTQVVALLSSCGTLYEIPEDLFDSFTALAGSSPAYVLSFIDAMALGGVQLGFSYETALSIVLNTLTGTGDLLKELGGNPNEWITRITSPAGTTIEGLAYLERKGFRGTVIRCLEKTSERARRLKA